MLDHYLIPANYPHHHYQLVDNTNYHVNNLNMASSHTKASWDDDAHKVLIGALLNLLEGNSISYRTLANQAALVASMADRGKPFTWEAIR